jgi:hypothetical protein
MLRVFTRCDVGSIRRCESVAAGPVFGGETLGAAEEDILERLDVTRSKVPIRSDEDDALSMALEKDDAS